MAHDILLCRELLAINPFKAKGKTIQRTKIWEMVVQHREEIHEPPFKVTVRAVRDRYSLLSKKFRKRMASEQKASGISPEMSELDILLEEHPGVEDQSEEKRLSETTRRKSQEENQPKKKARRSTSDTIEYLKQRNDAEFALRREELQLKRRKRMKRVRRMKKQLRGR